MPHKTAKLLGVFFVLAVGALAAGPAMADTYRLEHVFSTQSENFAGGDDYGDYIINITNDVDAMMHPNCGGITSFLGCYQTVYASDPSHPVISTVPPTLPVDPDPRPGNVASCAIPAAFDVIHEFCSNGHLFFSAFYNAPPGGTDKFGLFDGIDPTLDFLGRGSIDGGFMTANGNVFFIDGELDTLDVAIDMDTIPVPEPESLVLVGTGAFGAICAVRRRLDKEKKSGPLRKQTM